MSYGTWTKIHDRNPRLVFSTHLHYIRRLRYTRGHSTHSQLWMARHVEPTTRIFYSTKANNAILIKGVWTILHKLYNLYKCPICERCSPKIRTRNLFSYTRYNTKTVKMWNLYTHVCNISIWMSEFASKNCQYLIYYVQGPNCRTVFEVKLLPLYHNFSTYGSVQRAYHSGLHWQSESLVVI